MEAQWLLHLCAWITLFCEIGRAGPAGTEFITTFMQNGSPNLSGQRDELRITGLQDGCVVNVTVFGGAYKRSLTLGSGNTVSVQLPASVETSGSVQFLNTVYVIANKPIMVNSHNQKYRSGETSLIYPTTSLGLEYFILCPKTGSFNSYKVFSVLASGEDTSLEIYLKGSVQFNGKMYAANSILPLSLPAFHGVQLMSADDLSGTRVKSQKPVAVLSGHTCAQKNTQCSHVYEQLLPVSRWGSRFFVAPLSFQQKTDFVYVVAAGTTEVNYIFNTTETKQNMVVGQVLEIEMSKLPMKIEASAVVQVTFFSTGGRGRRFEYNPFLMNILDTDSYCTSYYIYGQGGTDNYAIIIAENSAMDGITLNGRRLDNPQWSAIPGTGFSWLEYNFGNSFTSHKVEHPTKTFGLQSVGIGTLMSYGTAGTCVKDPGPPPPTCRNVLCAPRQVCVIENGKPKCVKPQVDVCWASGDPHFRTLDNVYYDFMGTCTYTFASVCGDVGADHPKFTVRIKNDNRGNVRVSYVGQVTVQTGGHTIVVKKGEVGYVRVDNNLKQLPVSLLNGTLSLFQSGISVLIQLGNDVQVSYDWNHHLQLELTRSYAGKMCGMCGNYNQIPTDDFQTPAGTKAPDAIAFGGSWMMEDNTFCWHDCRGPCLSCPSNTAQKYSSDGYCGLISKKDGPLKECHAIVDPKMYLKNCLFDVCVNDGYKKISCEAVQAYADTCQRAGVNIGQWREAAGCPFSCRGNSTYKLCGKACPATCQDPEASAVCTDPCVESCECNPGFVLSEGKCIPKGSCGCSHNGFSYAPNEAFWNDTICRQRCVCNGQTQKVECKDSPCRAGEECVVKNGIQDCYPKSFGVCTAAGDPHYITFDGFKFDFQGTCIYQLTALSDHSRGLTDFQVRVRNQNRGNVRVSYTTAVFVSAYGQEIQASRQYPNKVMVNNILMNLPYRSPDGRFTLYRNPSSVVFSFDFNLKVTFDYNSFMRVTIPGTYAGALSGLCGNFNGNPGDDLTPKGGTGVTDATVFGRSWKVGELYRCRDDGGPVCNKLSSEEKRQRDGASECGVLLSRQGSFRSCHALVDPEPYFNSCVYDYCILEKRQAIFCSVLTSYVMACQAAGGTVYPWRSQDFCPFSCPDHSSYEICADACPVTCSGLSIPDGCDGNCTEGCVCNNGFILSGGECVPISECGCNYNGAYYTVGESIYDGERCSQRCTCTEGGIMKCVPSSCYQNEECRVEKGVLGCHPSGSATCTAAGYSHFRTLDKRPYDFHGLCSYVLAQSCEDNAAGSSKNLTKFRLVVKYERHDSIAGVIGSATVEVYGLNLSLRRQQRGVVQVNGETFRLPTTLLSGKVRAELYGQSIFISTDFGLQVTYDLKQHVTVTAPSNYKDSMCGLCGDYNGIAADDLGVSPNEINAFGNKWKVPGDPEEGCDGCGSMKNPCPSCPEPKKKIFSQNNYCGVISDTSGPFAKCHSLVNPTSFLNNCISDLCTTNGEESDVLCDSVAVYAYACKQAGIKEIKWRIEAFCPLTCGPHSHYMTCADMCSTSCASITDTYECSDLCDEGCECDEGYLFDGLNCVALSQCGCLRNGRNYQSKETVLNDDCSQECTCNPISGLSCQNRSCADGEKCKILDGVRTCVNTEPCKSKNCRLKETCKLQDGIAVCVPDYTGICWAWGDPHYHTLDGRDFDFQGTCSYILAKYTGDDPTLVPFQVVVKNDNRGSQAVSFAKRMEITIHDVTITIEVGEFPTIRVNGVSTNLPVILAGGKLNASQSGFTAIVEAESGMVFTFDWNWHSTVTLPSSYYNSVSGLCGNFNQDPNDDQRAANGTLVSSTTDWAGLWKVYDQDPFCFDHCPGECPTCDESKKKQYRADNNCGLIFKADGPFRECLSKVSANNFFDSCLFDVCMNDGARNILCQALESYASTCLREGVKLYDWRTPSGCSKICEDNNSHYNACGNACPASCSDRNAPAKCTKPCVETCECNGNMVLSGDKCVPISSCGCQYNGRYYEPNQSWYNEKCAVLCKCDPILGIVICQQAKCKKTEMCMLVNGIQGCYPTQYSTCIASGDPHYKTFDNKRLDYMGSCIYQLVKVTSNDSSLTYFMIKVQNDHRGNKAVSFTKDVILEVYNKIITMSRDYPQQIKVDGRITDLPYSFESTKLITYISGSDVVLKTGFGMTLTFDGRSYVRVIVPSTYKGAINGLCGNNNGDPSDDFTIDNGVIAKSPKEFGDHWKVGEVEGCIDECPDCPKCNEKEREIYKTGQYCGLLTKPDGPFSQCYATIDPTPYFNDCVFDACAYKGHQSAVCASIASYVSECQRNGSVIKDWRTPTFCGLICPLNSHYELRGDGCPATCYGLTAPPTCVKSHTEGCYCNNGFIRSGQDCVPLPECGCVFDNTYYKVGQEFYPDNLCQKKCTCGKNGVTTCRERHCGANEECKVVDGVLGCHAKEVGQCVAWGDPHYITLDNVFYDFQGTCSYTLISVKTDVVNFLVTVDNEPYGNVAVTKSVTVTIGDYVIHLGRARTWSIEVNRERLSLPWQPQNRQFWINEEGNNVIIQTKEGFKVLFDRQYYISVWVPSSYAGLTAGLCGNYNKDTTDELRLPNGTIVTDIGVFGESWVVDGDGSDCQGCTGDQCPTCDADGFTEAKSPPKCGLIADPKGPFKNCHSLVPPDRYTKSCVFDVCAAPDGQDALCASLQAYTALCQEKGAKIESWRDIASCPHSCPANSQYKLCTRTCGFTCNGLFAPSTCSHRCFEGCECDTGYMSDGDKCVTMDNCGCNYNGRYLRSNETVLHDDCSQECTCSPIFGVSCRNTSCAQDERCQILDGVRNCVNKDLCKYKTCRVKESCQVQDDKAVCVPDFSGMCWAWGDPHFHTLDGLDFDFQGTCSYILSKYSGDDPTLVPFQILIKNDNRGSQAGSFVREMEITIYDMKITIKVGEFPNIRVNGESTNLPVILAGGKLKVSQSGLMAIVEAESGLVFTFDWNWHSTVTLPSSYYSSVSGLCGNFNQDPKDDQRAPNGTLVSSTTDWAGLWKVYDRDPFCFDHCPDKCPTCDESKKKQYEGDNNCGLIFKADGPFRECLSKVSPNNFFDSCLFDVCLSDGAQKILCQALESYASTCLREGVKLYDWRTPSDCPKICEDKNSHYNACGNACPAYCAIRNASAKCTKPCVETCECNGNMVLSGDKCVPISNCGCQYNGRYYEPNQSWYNDKCTMLCKCDPILGKAACQSTRCKNSETCKISNGIRRCYPKESSTCTASGDPHYKTFDNKRFSYMGACTYQLVKVTSNDSSLTRFTVKALNEQRGNKVVSFTKDVILEVFNKTIIISRDYPQQIQVDGILTNLPYYYYKSIRAYMSGDNMFVIVDFGLVINYDRWSNVRLALPSTYTGAVNGLCGNNNGDPSDDFTMDDGATAKSPVEFGEHWKVEEGEECMDECPDCPKCNEKEREIYKTGQYCGLLTKPDGPFSECYAYIDPSPYFDNCVFDACAYKGHQSVVCASIASYVSECQHNGSLIKEWRTPSFCEMICPLNSHYKFNGDGCPATCFGLTAPPNCVQSFTEGCYCNNGFIRSGQDCVPLPECGCVFDNTYYKVGQEFYPDNLCQKKCTCGKNGVTTCQERHCGANEECKVVDGVLGCHAKEVGQCVVWGDPHYITLDNVFYDFQGTCTYTLVRVQTDAVNFLVTVDNEPYGCVAVTKSVTVTIGDHVIDLERARAWSIVVNRERYNLPWQSQNHEFWVNEEGNNVIIQTKVGFKVMFDRKYYVSVWVPSSYTGLTKGLCGNYNKDTTDEFRLPNGTIVTDVAVFGESWTVDGDGSDCKGCSGDQCPTCDAAGSTEANSPTKCGMIADPQGPFKECHALLPPERYAKSCVFDVCAGRGGQEALCASLQAYMALCQEKGAKIGAWRDIVSCPLVCQANSHYELCSRTCGLTCHSLFALSTCSDRCYEGCVCDSGYIFDGDRCVEMDKCGCIHNGRYLKMNETVMNDDCSQECACNPISGISCHNRTCAQDERCQILDGVRSCVSTNPCKIKTCRVKESCQVKDDKAVCVPDFNGFCWAWGDPHFHTLDGHDFDFQGTCSYILSKYTGDDPTLAPFQILIKNDNRGSQAASFVKKVEITIYDMKIAIQVREFPQIRVNDELTNLPVSLAVGKLNVSQSGLTAIVEAECGVIFTFDWNWHCTVTVPSSYYNSVDGLCGNFNQDTNDDQRAPNGTLVSSIADWAGLWKVYDRDPFCFDYCLGECPTCDEIKKKQYGSDNNCGLIFKEDGPFRECTSKVDPKKFFNACLFDVCMSDGAKNILCQALYSYASTCMNQGVMLYDWRTPSGCFKICEDKNSHYNACGNACPASCSNRNAPATCTKPCLETCACNDNMVLSGDKCVPISSCGCQYNERYYKPNQSWYNDQCAVLCKCDPVLGIVDCQQTSCKESETCMVVNGIRGCYPTKYSTCTASGDPHYKTFDNKRFPYMGNCIYQLVKVTSNDSSLTRFTINVQNDHRGNKAVSFTKDVILEVYNKTIIMSKEFPLQIKIDGQLKNLPYYFEATKLIVYNSGADVVLKTEFDMTMTYDGWNYMRLILPSTYTGAVSGLCGNNNGDPSDDFTIDDGVTAKTPEEFGEHWKVGEVEGCMGECSDCPKCNEKEREIYKNDQYCGLLTKPDGPFSQCYDFIDPTPYFDDCVYDACAYRGHQSVVCTSIASYVSDCQRNGTLIKEWRTPSFCEIICPLNSHYELSGDGCPATCYGLTAPPTCVKSHTEGCYCNNGFIRSGQDCVPLPECGCVSDNTYYKVGQEFYTDNLCQKKCTCGKNGVTTCQDSACGANEECKVVDGVLGCHAKEVGQCVAWGDPHYITLDNLYFVHQGTCSYTLVKVNRDRVHFLVTVDNEPNGNVAVPKSVTVTIGDHVIYLERDKAWSIVVNRENYNLPCQSQNHNFWINEEGNNVIIQTKDGFKVMFNRKYYVSVWVPSSYTGLTAGLCGNYNKDTTDEFRLPNGTIVTDVAVFGESWAVAGDGSDCKGCSGDQCPTCNKAGSTEANSPTKCGMIADPQGPFKECHALVPPERYAKSCVFDVCAGRGGQEALCASLQAYMALCQEKGANIGAWRDKASCSHSCPANSQYKLCTRTCDFTCNGLFALSTCSHRCFEGCECDTGYMFDGDKCVTMDNCGCSHKGRYFKANESVVSEDCSQRCTCQSGVVSCANISCAAKEVCQLREGRRSCQSRESQCTLRADHHFTTFDGVSGLFPMEGSYVMASSCNATTEDQFMVVVELRNCSGTSKKGKSLQIFTSRGMISVNGEREIWLNGQELQAPSVLGGGAVKVLVSQSELTIELLNQLILVLTAKGEIKLIGKERIAGNTCGPCGNFNGDGNDDLRLKNGDSSMDITFTIHSWIARHQTTCSV